MKRERVRTRGFKGFGRFMLGWFIGFVSTLLVIVGIAYWAYTSISVRKVEKWTKSDITSNKEVEKLTLQDVVAIAMGVAKGSDDYTLAKLEEDFGVKILGDSLYGISLDKLKNAPIKEFKTAINDTIDSATFNNVLSFMDVNDEELGLLKTVLDSTVTYYVNDGKLYTNEELSIEVGFDYTVEGDTVKFSNGTHTIASNKINPRLSDLPLNTAITSMEDVTNDLKIYEVLGYDRTGTEGNYVYEDGGVVVTGIMKTLAGYSVGDLSNSETFEGLYIHEVMGYTQLGNATDGYTYKDGETDVTGIMSKLAGKTIKQLSADDAFDDITVADAMGYHYDETSKKWYTSTSFIAENEVKGVIKHLAGSNLKGLSADVQGLTIGKILDVEQADATGVIKALWGSNLNTLKADIDGLTLGEALGVEQASAAGVIKVLYGTKITELNTAMGELKVYDAMGYYYDETNDKYYNKYNASTGTYEEKVVLTGIMKAIANTEVDQLTTTINTLKAKDVFDVEGTPVLRLFIKDYGKATEDRTELNNLNIMDLPNAVVNKLNDNTVTIGDLVDAGIIDRTDIADDDPVRLLTISGLIDLAMQYS